MNAARIKAICHAWAERLGRGGHGELAHIAGRAPSVWSEYSSQEEAHADKTPPAHILLKIEDTTGFRDFSRAVAARLDGEAQTDRRDPRIAGARALEAIARAELLMTEAYADGVITETEKRALLAEGQRLADRAQQFAAAIAALRPGAQVG
jgi:hypothetical protein